MLNQWSGIICLARKFGEERNYKVTNHFTFSSRKGKFSVLPGFVTDGASVPRLFWAYASPFAGLHVPAVILHDALYATHHRNRKFCDKLLYEALLSLGIRKSKAWLMYQSVRAGGWAAWKKSKKKVDSQRRFLVVTA